MKPGKDPIKLIYFDEYDKVIMDIVHAMQSDTEPHILEYYLQRDDH